jgi:hypothetical protein
MDVIDELKKLKNLLENEAITIEEFNSLKKNILASNIKNDQGNTKGNYAKKSRLNPKKAVLINSFLFLVLFAVFCLANFDKIRKGIYDFGETVFKRENLAGEKPEKEESNVIYEGGDRLGILVERRLDNSQMTVFELKIPTGKIWTPMYFEAQSSRCSYVVIPEIYPEKSVWGDGWFRPALFHFPEKRNFSSYKAALRNHKALADEFAIQVDGCRPTTYLLYFLEQ